MSVFGAALYRVSYWSTSLAVGSFEVTFFASFCTMTFPMIAWINFPVLLQYISLTRIGRFYLDSPSCPSLLINWSLLLGQDLISFGDTKRLSFCLSCLLHFPRLLVLGLPSVTLGSPPALGLLGCHSLVALPVDRAYIVATLVVPIFVGIGCFPGIVVIVFG